MNLLLLLACTAPKTIDSVAPTDDSAVVTDDSGPVTDDTQDTAPPADPTLAEQLQGTHWTNRFDGARGTFVTWFTFDEGALPTVRELQLTDGGSELMWTTTGSWSTGPESTVDLVWFEPYGDDAVRHNFVRNHLPVSGALAQVIISDTHRVDAPMWTDIAYAPVEDSPGLFRARYLHAHDDPDGSGYADQVDGALSLDSLEPGPCALTLTIDAYSRSYEGLEEQVTEEFSYDCEVVQVDGLRRVDIAGFEGELGELRSAWRQEVNQRGLSDSLAALARRVFVPQLWFEAEVADRLLFPTPFKPQYVWSEGPPPG